MMIGHGNFCVNLWQLEIVGSQINHTYIVMCMQVSGFDVAKKVHVVSGSQKWFNDGGNNCGGYNNNCGGYHNGGGWNNNGGGYHNRGGGGGGGGGGMWKNIAHLFLL